MYVAAYRFSNVVEGFKSVTTCHAGDGAGGNTKLYHAHDLAETLQYCYEGLPEVDICFVSTI